MEFNYAVPKIKCEGCAGIIREALAAVPGVEKVVVNVAEKVVTVVGTDVLADAVLKALADCGFPAE